ncbi:MAG: hypothetical protein SVU88_01340 [Candidatus Nanohaloarchaea archaeon]|nr:hypothetical protein [Candidatus Nanohaloarchaea archaeon]
MDVVPRAFLKAAAAAALFILIGALVGLQMDDTRTSYLDEQLQEANLQTELFLVTDNYLEESSQNYCTVVRDQIPVIARENAEIGQDLQSFSSKSISEQQDYRYIQRRYYVSQLKLYNMLRTYRQRCSSNVTLVFFFFDDSADSRRQGAALTEYRRTVDNRTYVFSYNLEADNSQVLDILTTDFGITDGPAIVVNGNRTYRRYVPFKELKTVLGRG